MVFGWGRKKPPEIPQVRTIRLDDAAGIATDALKVRSERTITEAAAALHRTNGLIRELVQIRAELEADDINEDHIDKRVRPLAIRGKRMLVDALKSNALEIKPIRTYEDMVRAGGELEHRLKRVGNILGKQTRIIHMFAEKYAARLKQILEEVEAGRGQILEATSRHQRDTALAGNVTGGIEGVHSMERSIEENAAKLREAMGEDARMESRLHEIGAEIARFKESAGYRNLLALQDKEKEQRGEIASLKAEISAQFTKISRPLGRYSRITADKEQAELLERLQDSPFDTIGRAGQESVVMLLEGVRKATSSGSISVKDTGKAIEAIVQTQKAVDGFVSRISMAEERAHDTARQIEKAKPTELYRLEGEGRRLNESRDMLSGRIGEIENAMKRMVESVPNEIRSIHDSLERLTGARYDIEYSPLQPGRTE